MIKTDDFDYFTQDELIAVYEKAGSPEEADLRAAALSLFPERMQAEKPPMLRVETGIHGRWFYLDEARTVIQEPKYTIKSGRCCWVGVMEDGSVQKY